jgi:hypothetical protein
MAVRLPFNLDLISILVGMALVWFVLPWILGFVNKPKASTAPTTT